MKRPVSTSSAQPSFPLFLTLPNPLFVSPLNNKNFFSILQITNICNNNNYNMPIDSNS